MRNDTTPWGYTLPEEEEAGPTWAWRWLWYDIDLTLWGLAVLYDHDQGVVGLIIGPLKFGVQW